MRVVAAACFVYHRNMVATGEASDEALARIAAAIGEPARARMLCCLMDGHARTSTELAGVAQVTAPTASAHLKRLHAESLVRVLKQGRHRYYSLRSPRVARALEGLSVLSAGAGAAFRPSTPSRLRAARSCYDHMAGSLAVSLHDRLRALGWIRPRRGDAMSYEVTADGASGFAALGLDVAELRARRRRWAFGCLDWSERRPHLAGTLGAALLELALRRKWVLRALDSRELIVSARGRRELRAFLGVEVG
ncbi:MAG TPA: ArsR family transcriptional regulator [Steroidobacteraceae bacterium]|nr:ArsR family transcriptional regulator [Steroidobacteraceae bacterium]